MPEILIWLAYLGVSFGVFLGFLQPLIKNGFKYKGIRNFLIGIFGIALVAVLSLLWPTFLGEALVERKR